MAEHTKGKIKVCSSTLIVTDEARIIANTMPVMVDELKLPLKEAIANAKHLVLCWNNYEWAIKRAQDLAEELTAVKQQRDDLLAALEDLVFHVINNGVPYSVLKEKIKAAQQAIAKAKPAKLKEAENGKTKRKYQISS